LVIETEHLNKAFKNLKKQKNMMKVLMLGWELPPHNSGGLGVACMQLCKALAKKGADIDFILPYSAEHKINFMNVRATQPSDVLDVVKSGIAYDSYKFVYKDGKEQIVDLQGQQEAYEHAVADIAKETSFDVIHAHDWLTFRAALKIRQTSDKPLILHVHSIESDRAGGGIGNPLVREIESMSMLIADKVIAVSQHTKNKIVKEYKIPEEKIQVVHNSLEVEDITPLDDDNAYYYLTKMKEQGYKVVVNVGRLTIQKGLPNLLRAAKEVIQRAPKTLFLVVGSGEQENELISLASQYGIGKNVLFVGFQRGKKWRDAFAIADLFVMPSVSEPFGLTPLEAIGYGTPALISKQSGVSEILINCLKVDFWNVDELANQITAVVMNNSLAEELHHNSFREFQKMTWTNAADALINVYEKHMYGVAT
jgi:glycogen synthase